MAKLTPVLCIKRNALLLPADGSFMWTNFHKLACISNQDCGFISRTFCDGASKWDTAPAEHYLQVLPYVVVTTEDTAGNEMVLMYDRGNGAEAKLHAYSSVGFGGHIDVSDFCEDEHGEFSLERTMHIGLSRELNEELGLTQSVIDKGITPLSVLIDYTDDVGKRHLCALYKIKLTGEEANKLDLDNFEIANAHWKYISEVMENISAYNLESWSKKSLGYLSVVSQTIKN